MTYLSSSKDCPKCSDQHKGKPFCTYANGVHCFSCGYTENYDRSFSVTQKPKINIPNMPDCCFDPARFSVNNLLWLSKYYITPDLIRKHNISEAPDGALVFCTIENDEIIHVQKRYIQTERVIKSYGPKIPSKTSIGSHTAVIVEDPLSSIRVGEHADSVCLYGTKCSYEVLKGLLTYKRILVWLDNDKNKEKNSGQIAANKICNMQQRVISLHKRRFSFGCVNVPVVQLITTEFDPKCYSPTEIRHILGDVYVCSK